MASVTTAVKFVGEKSGRLAGTSSGCQEIGEVMLGADSTWKPRLAICGKEISTVLPAGRTLIFQASPPASGSVAVRYSSRFFAPSLSGSASGAAFGAFVEPK